MILALTECSLAATWNRNHRPMFAAISICEVAMRTSPEARAEQLVSQISNPRKRERIKESVASFLRDLEEIEKDLTHNAMPDSCFDDMADRQQWEWFD